MTSTRTPHERHKLIREHREAILELEAEETAQSASKTWPPEGFYLVWHLMVGITLGGLGALVSLGFNVIGAPLFGQPALQLIRVYLTFPMGERALTAEEGLVLSVGAGLYLITGALLGIAFHLFLRGYRKDGPVKIFVMATLLGLAVWIVNFYLVLSWLQPALLGGRWILDEIPFWVAALTHLSFAWTIGAGEAFGRVEHAPGGGR